jgi:translation initiation factor eIF-2B subunit delta
MSFEVDLAKIRADTTSGATQLAKKAALTIARTVENGKFQSTNAFRRFLNDAVRAIVATQPAMAPMINLASLILEESKTSRDLDALRDKIASAARFFARQMDENSLRVAERSAELIQDGMVIMTHSSSQAVLQALLKAKSARRPIEVVCTESRPTNEGIGLARRLAKQGIRVTLIADAAMMSKLQQASLVIVGADAITAEGLVNKMGTALLALAARKLRKKMYALCGSEKFVPAGYRLPLEPPKDPTELLPRSVPKIAVWNYYFDLTPLGMLTGVVSEDGLVLPAELRRRLKRLKAFLPQPA